jgi:hypothetical protein
VDWVDLVQFRDKWWAVVSTVTNPHIPYNASKFLTEWLFASQKGLCSVELVSPKLQHAIAHNK